jgi:hypothetical protein
MNDYPEHDKLSAIKGKSQEIGEFLDWLRDEKDYQICSWVEGGCGNGEYNPIFRSTENLLTEYFNIDLKKLEKEKQKMLDELRAKH